MVDFFWSRTWSHKVTAWYRNRGAVGKREKQKKSWWPVSRYKMSATPAMASVTGIWYSGIMLASGARGPGFNSRNPPIMIGPTATGGSVIRYSAAHRQEYNFFGKTTRKWLIFFFVYRKPGICLFFFFLLFRCHQSTGPRSSIFRVHRRRETKTKRIKNWEEKIDNDTRMRRLAPVI